MTDLEKFKYSKVEELQKLMAGIPNPLVLEILDFYKTIMVPDILTYP